MPDDIETGKALEDLTVELRQSSKWWNALGPKLTKAGRVDNGVRVITYTFDAKDVNVWDFSSFDSLSALTREQQTAVYRVLGDIEKVANVKFKYIGHVDEVNSADIRLFRGNLHFDGFDSSGSGKGGGACFEKNGIKSVILNNGAKPETYEFGYPEYGTVTHEILHAMGLSHPGADGENASYNKDDTIMSYNNGRPYAKVMTNLDVAALQYLYGKAKNAPAVPTTIRADDLPGMAILEATHPVTIDARKHLPADENQYIADNELIVDMGSKGHSGHVDGTIKRVGEHKSSQVGVRLMPDTRIQHVLSDSKSMPVFNITGNELPNIMQGGPRNDVFKPRGGNDVLTGNGGRNTYYLTPDSGMNNQITDFDPKNDQIFVAGDKHPQISSVIGSKEAEVIIHDKEGKPVSSIRLRNQLQGIDPFQIHLDLLHTNKHISLPPKPDAGVPMAAKRGK